MSKLILMKGLPASGKSTKAKEIYTELGNAVRINRDLLRTMLHFDKWTPQNEKLTIDAASNLARAMLQQSKVVIIDDTNLDKGTQDKWEFFANAMGAKFEVVDLTSVPPETCVQRDMERGNKVGKEVIMNMARKNGLYKSDKLDVIVDIDGTVADCSHRSHLVQNGNKQWAKFFDLMSNDLPREDIIQRVRDLSVNYNIVMVSGRPETYKKQTIFWLERYKVPYETLIMRGANDSRKDDIVKQEILDKYFDKSKIFKCIDDRPSVIRMWRSNGLEVDDVGPGYEF